MLDGMKEPLGNLSEALCTALRNFLAHAAEVDECDPTRDAYIASAHKALEIFEDAGAGSVEIQISSADLDGGLMERAVIHTEPLQTRSDEERFRALTMLQQPTLRRLPERPQQQQQLQQQPVLQRIEYWPYKA